MSASGVADLGPLNRSREQKAWYWYDWANSAFATTDRQASSSVPT